MNYHLLHIATTMSDHDNDDEPLCKFLSENGLNIKWLKHFKDKKIMNVNQIHDLDDESKYDLYQSLSLDATPAEIIALRKIFEIEAPIDSDDGLDRELREVGLDITRWSHAFKTQLGVKSPQALQHVGDESYQLLAQFAEQPWEKKALRKLLGIETVFQTQREKQRAKLEKRQTESVQLLEALKLLEKEGKDRQDNTVKSIEGRIRERLQISEEVWLKEDITLKQAIAQIEAMLSGDDVSELSVIERASGGLALQGILITTDPNMAAESRQHLLKVPKDICLDGPLHSPYENKQQFSCKRKEDEFSKRFKGLGYSASASAKAGFWGVTFEPSAGYSKNTEKETTGEHHHEETYCSMVKYFVMPMASCSFKDHQLQLSEAALTKLQKINQILVSDATKSIQKECEAFFQKFGSHACIGPLHFGGRYTWKSYSSGFKESDKSTIQELQREAITVQVGMSYGGVAGASASTGVSSMTGNFEGEYSMALTSQTFIEVTVTGGPPEVTGLLNWKNRLIASNRTWHLIDRGTHGVPVWEIIEMNHSSSFKNCSHFVERLKQAWHILNRIDEPQNASTSEFQSMMDGVSSWNKTPDPTQFTHQLGLLAAEKEKVSKEFLDPQVWATDYLSQEPLKQFLQSVANFALQGTGDDSDSMKRYLQQLVEPIDLHTTRVFHNQQYILKWLYGTEDSSPPIGCQDFLSLNKYFKLAFECIHGEMLPLGKQMMETAVSPDRSIKVTATVAKATLCFRRSLQESGQKYEDLFTTTMLYPFKYSPSKYRFSALMSMSDLKYLCERFESEVKEFFSIKATGSLLRLQSYLFLLTANLYDYFDVSEEQILDHTKYLKGKIGDEMKPELKKVITLVGNLKLKDCEHDWLQFKNELDPLLHDTPIKPGDGDMLLNILEKNQTEKSPQKAKPLNPFKSDKEMENFFMRLHLNNQFPQKLSLHNAIMIREDTLEVSKVHQISKDDAEDGSDEKMESLCYDPHSYPFLILQKIMAFDHRCRMALASESRNESKSDSRCRTTLVSKSPNESECNSCDEDEDDTEAMTHPMDGLLALLHCSDNFLRKDLMSRLATCQLAVPLLLPDPITKKPTFLLWALRSIIMEFQNYNNTVSYAGPIICYSAPIISFLRLGKHSISKSGLLNAVISASNHDTFFHYDCAGGRAKTVLVNGLVEVSWYLPSKIDRRLPNAITFANLHGNASEYTKQVQFLSKVSCMHFIFLNEGDLDDYTLQILKQLSEAPGGIVVLQTHGQSSSGLKQKLKQSVPEEKMSIIKLSSKNKNDMKVSIHKRINSKLNTNVPLALEDCKKVACDCGIEVDEDEPQCATGRKLVNEFFKHVNEYQKSNLGSSPKKLLVLQSKELWHKYGETEKEQYRQMLKAQISMYEYSGLQQDKMNQIRKRQLAQSKKLSPLMSSFLTSLLNSEGEITWYYLHWLKIYLDDLSRELLPPLHGDYQKKRMELNAIQKQDKKDEAAEEKCRFEMNELNMQLIDASFGPEHLFREIGQLYEAVMSQTNAPNNLKRKISRLPEIAAQLLFDGFPLELMDGDAAHVPLKWVTSVLEKLSELLEGKKVGPSTPQVFVLSVLGLQSTGKSTMLNTIFGVQFSVSAGRCTRGAFMQLLPVHESLQKRCGFQYFLLIDTEGLRAPELDALKMQKHDNELATFVIGLANLTIINIKGEISGDMNDVLQTTVHAFLRMNEVKLRASCHFSYQNVPAVTAGEKAMQGRFKIKDKLDAMTKEAAEQTGLQGSFRYFSDVITFDYENDVSFFPDLWTGSPPMAHVSEFYSVEAQTLKHYLIKGVEQNQRSRNHSLLQLKEHLGELWKAILQENFVFSFKNTYEIAEYTKLEEEYSEWSRSFKKQMDDWERAAHSELMGCLLEKLKEEYQRKKDELPKYVKAVYDKLEGKMNTYFEESTAQDIIAKWKVDIAGDLKHLKKELERHASNKCDQLFNARNSRAKADSKIESLGSEIMEHVQQVASTLKKGELSEKQLEKKFKESWVKWITELIPNIEQIKPPNIKHEVENSVREYQTLKAHHKLLHQKLTLHDARTGKPKQWGMHLQLKVKPVHLKVLQQPTLWHEMKTKAKGAVDYVAGSHWAVEPFIGPAQEKTNIVFTEVKTWLTNKKHSGEDFKPNFTTELLDLLFLNIAKDPSDRYDFQPEYSVEMALTACGYAQKIFEEMSEAFCQKHDPLVYIETELKEACWKQFKDNYNDIEKEKSAAETLCSQLKNPIQMQVLLDLEGDICEEMRAEYKWLKSKKRLRAKVLHDIGDKLEEDRKRGRRCEFRDCAHYLRRPAQSLERWIKKYTDDYCNDRGTGGQTRVSKIATEKLLIKVELVKKSACDVTALLSGTVLSPSQTQGQCCISDWLDGFHDKLKGRIILDMTKLRMFGQDVMLKSVTFFQDEVVRGLDEIHKQLKEEFKIMSASVWNDHQLVKKPYNTLFGELAGCTEQCPFCKQQCDLTNPNHSVLHSVTHRPQCLGGYRWERDDTMILDVCTFLVDSNSTFRNKDTNNERYPYSDYKKFYPKWDIPKERSLSASEFWIWLVGNFSEEIEKCYGYSRTKIYDDWKRRKWSDVKPELVKDQEN